MRQRQELPGVTAEALELSSMVSLVRDAARRGDDVTAARLERAVFLYALERVKAQAAWGDPLQQLATVALMCTHVR